MSDPVYKVLSDKYIITRLCENWDVVRTLLMVSDSLRTMIDAYVNR